MIVPMLLLAVVQAANAAPTSVAATVAPLGDEIVVTAEHRRCDVRLADRTLSTPDFNSHAAGWAAGRPVHVVAPPDAKVRCLAKIMFRLADHGVKQAIFVDAPVGPAAGGSHGSPHR